MTVSRTLGYYQGSIGSRQFALQKTREIAKKFGNTRLVKKIDDALAAFATAASLELKYLMWKKSNQHARHDAARLDVDLDNAVANLYAFFRLSANRRTDSPEKALAQAVLDDVFRRGINPITSSLYEEEHSLVNTLVAELKQRHPDARDRLHARPLVEDVVTVNGQFGKALDVLDRETVTYPDVQAQVAKAEHLFNDVTFIVFGDYCDDEDKRAALLQAIEDQDARNKSYFKRRGKAPEVNPGTGEVLDGDVTTPGAPDPGDTPPAADAAAN